MSQRSANSVEGPGASRRLGRLGALTAGLSLAALAWSLSGMTLDRSGTAQAAADNARVLWPFWIASGACWAGLTLLWLGLRRTRSGTSARAAATVLAVAVAARLVVLMSHDPALSDDVYRYIFDGRNLANGFNPYLTDPDDRLNAIAAGATENWSREGEILVLLAYPEVTTPYLPVSQHVFAVLGAASERVGWVTPRASARAFRAGLVAIEIAMMLMVLAVLRARRLSPWWLALYAWHPLAIDGFAASGHQDIIGIALMVAAMATIGSPTPIARQTGYAVPGAVPREGIQPTSLPPACGWKAIVPIVVGAMSLAMSVMVKPIAALALLVMLRRSGWRDRLLVIIVGASICGALALPLRWFPRQPSYIAWRQTADWMAEKTAHFGGLYEPVLCVVRHAMPDGPQRKPGFNLEQEWLARKICMGVLAAALLAILVFARDHWRATAAGMLALTLCSTTCHPWYLLWGLALIPLAAGCWALWIYSLTICFGYAVFFTGKGHAFGVEWTLPPSVLAIAYIPVVLGLCMDAFRRVGRAPARLNKAAT